MLTEELLEFFNGPVAAAVATSNAVRRPTFTRLVGVFGTAGERQLHGLVPEALAGRALVDLSENANMAITVADITTMHSRQFKGRFVGKRAAEDAETQLAKDYFARTAPVVGGFFGPGCGAGWERLLLLPLLVITLDFNVLFDQTPGPNAGKELS